MKIQLLIFILGLFTVISTDGRLIQKNKTRIVEVAVTEKPNPAIRLTRDIENDSLTGFSKEESVQSEEFIKSYNRRARFYFKSKPKAPKAQAQKPRITRDSMENIKPSKSEKPKNELKLPAEIKPKAVLVKKPIPKFYEKDYDDFQSKISNSHIIADSFDNEDEDFNLEDYDFDINHDEFTSGRKPLEPRISIKNIEGDTRKPNMKIISKIIAPVSLKTVSNKKERATDQDSETSIVTKMFDYYDDITTTKSPEKNDRALDDEYSDENEDNKKSNHKSYSRTIRSWNVNLFGNKFKDNMPRIMTKYLGVLPLFPQAPSYYKIKENSDLVGISVDPLHGR